MQSHKSVRYTHMMRNAFAHGSFCSGSFLVTCMAMVNEGMMHVMCSRAKHRSEKAWPSGESGERVFALFAPVVRVQPALADVGSASLWLAGAPCLRTCGIAAFQATAFSGLTGLADLGACNKRIHTETPLRTHQPAALRHCWPRLPIGLAVASSM
jgi:hypothetical protein